MKGHILEENHLYVIFVNDKAFSLKSNLMQHLMSHTIEKPFQCGNCEKAFQDEHANGTSNGTYWGETSPM